MLVGATERGLSVSRFDMKLPTPLFMCPIGVIGLCAQDFHGDIQVAKASAQTGVPMVASTLTEDRMEDVVPHAEGTPGIFQLYTRTTKTSLRASWLAPSGPDIGRSSSHWTPGPPDGARGI
jgi:lactate 2-monooxygenase